MKKSNQIKITPVVVEFNEGGRFRKFLVDTRRIHQLAELEARNHLRTPDCVHMLENFYATATKNHPDKAKHLKRLEDSYKPFRAHALRCKRCQHTLDSIFAFTGQENQDLFQKEETKRILRREAKFVYDGTEKQNFIIGLPQPGFSKEELIYASRLPLDKAIEVFEQTMRIPLRLKPFREVKTRNKTTYDGKGTPYIQAYLSTVTEEQLRKHQNLRYTRVSIRAKS